MEKACKYKKVNIINAFRLWGFLKNNKNVIEFFYPHPFTLKQIYKNILTRDYFVMQISGNNVTGYGMLRGWEDGFVTPSLGIIIDKEFRGVGLSKLLMNHLHDVAKQRGAKEVMLKVVKDNTKAINLYKLLDYKLQIYDHKFLIGYKKLN
jgi:ribosomal protein S18 acetylase RimI-like enzyme